MSLQNLKTLRKDRGFTIVELLIVIVVIGILAAIIIVAYNGITNNARNNAWRSDAQNLAKIAEIVNTEEGSYPTGANTAALETSFNSSGVARVPNNIDLLVGEAPTNAVATTNAEKATKEYTVELCTGGLIIYYPSATTIQRIDIGTTTSC